MYKFGLKLWSTNDFYINEAIRLYNDGLYNYIELYVVPSSFDKYSKLWEKINIPYVIHAPHFGGGMNLSLKSCFDRNMELTEEVFNWVNLLKANKIIYHPGIAGDIKETARQLNLINDSRILIENKPYYTIDKKLVCNGHSPSDIEYLVRNSNVGFCFDIGHAIYSANAQKLDPLEMMKSFIKLNPKMFHLSDGDYHGVIDKHLNFGVGDYDMQEILKLIHDESFITVETQHIRNNLMSFESDVSLLNGIYINLYNGLIKK